MITIKIYTLTNPIDGNVFYIGRTFLSLELRLKGHLGRESLSYFSKKNIIMQEILENNLKPIIEEVESYICTNANEEVFVNKMEEYYIIQFKAWGFNITNFHGIKTAYKPKALINWDRKLQSLLR